MKIGKLVKSHIQKIFHYCETVDHDELSRLMDGSYSKEAFGINFPFCTAADQIAQENSKRYWTDTYIVRGENIRVSSQWIERSRKPFSDYLVRLKLTSEDELTTLAESSIESDNSIKPQPRRNSRYRNTAIGNAQNAVVRNILSNLGHESFSETDWVSTKEHFSNQCAYCGADGDLVIEHVIPINRTSLGEHRLGNLVPSCKPCNAKKGDKDYREFLSDSPQRIDFIQSYMDNKNYVPLGDNEQVAMVLEMAYKEVSSVADRYIAILNRLFPSG